MAVNALRTLDEAIQSCSLVHNKSEWRFVMHRHLIIGFDHESSIDNLREQLDLASNQIGVLTRIHSVFLNSPQYKSQVIPIREPQESRLQQVIRLLSLRNQFISGTCYWRRGKSIVFNLITLMITFLMVGMSCTIMKDGRIYRPKDIIKTQFHLPKFELLAFTLSILSLLMRIITNISYIIALIITFPIKWFQPVFGSTSFEQIHSFLSEITAKYFRIADDIEFGSPKRRLLARAKIAIWAMGSVLWTVIFYPFAITFSFFQKPSDKKRVLLVSHESRINGAPQSLLTILEAMDRTEFDPILVSAGEGLLTLRARTLNIPVLVLPLSQVLTQNPGTHLITSFCRLLINVPCLIYIMVFLRIKIVHTNVLVTPDAAIAARMLGITHIWHFREFIKNNRWSKFQIKVMDWFSDRVFCNSDYSRRLVNSKGVFWHKMVTVHNALDMRTYTSEYHGSRFRNSLNVTETEILVGCVGQITPVKGQETFVRSAIEVAKKLTNVKFVLVGTLENQAFIKQLQELINNENLADRITFSGYRTDIPEVMAGLDIHVTPSHWAEPFGRVALEAMALGAVSVVTKAGGLPEIVENEVSGLIVDPGDVLQLTNSLVRLIEDETYRKKLKRAGIKRAQHLFSIQKHVDDIQQVYRYPKPMTSYWSHFPLWTKIQRFLPGRMRSHPKLLVIYPLLSLLVVGVWGLALPLFFTLLPLSILFGWLRRNLTSKRRVAILAYQPERNASTRYRITKIFNYISPQDMLVKIYYPSSNWLADKVYVPMFYGSSPHVRDFYYYVIVFVNRLQSILKSYFYHCVVIQYELFNQGPMWMEMLVASTHPYTIYDYDDSLYAFSRFAKNLPGLLKRITKVVVGNKFLLEYTKQFNQNITIIPTCPDPDIFPARNKINQQPIDEDKEIKIGWVGNPANLCYLPMLKNALVRLANEYLIRFAIISAGPYELEGLDLKDIPIKRIEWSLQREGSDISQFDIGVMPVLDDDVGKGKCGFKALQYMAAGIPCVISPVGVNTDIVKHGITGYLANSEEEWYTFIKLLIQSPELRKKMGEESWRFTLTDYSLQDQAIRWRRLLSEK